MNRSFARIRHSAAAASSLLLTLLLFGQSAQAQTQADIWIGTPNGDEIHLTTVDIEIESGRRGTTVSLVQAGAPMMALFDALASGAPLPYLEIEIHDGGAAPSSRLGARDAFFVPCGQGTTIGNDTPCKAAAGVQNLVIPTRLRLSLELVRVVAVERANFVGMDSFIYTVIDDGSSIH